VRRALPIALALLLALPASALALTNQQFKDLANTKPSGDGTPQVGLDVGGGLVRGVVGFVVVIGVILLIAKLLKVNAARKNGTMPRGRGRDSNMIEVLSTTPLGPNRQLHMVRVGDEVILVGAGEGGITPLRSFNEDEAVALGAIASEDEQVSGAFSDALVRAGASVPARRRSPSAAGLLDRVRALTSR
jgi:flagellar biogenesis protein FliO